MSLKEHIRRVDAAAGSRLGVCRRAGRGQGAIAGQAQSGRCREAGPVLGVEPEQKLTGACGAGGGAGRAGETAS